MTVTSEDLGKAVRLSGVLDMFKAFNARLVYDDETGRYTNASIKAWMDSCADGLVYGVQLPLYSYSTETGATKTDANAGLVLEPSTYTTAGQNDYLNKKLFMCPRVNGGVDADGMPYVTAIEGVDDRFNSKTANTWILTPVYYFKYTKTDTHILKQFCDSPKPGYKSCYGAYTSANKQRPYILRGCYLIDTLGQATSKSGIAPCGEVSYSTVLEYMNGYTDGMGFLTSGDWMYQIDFMQLMLGTKSLTAKALGYQGYPLSSTGAEGTGETSIKVSASSGAWIKPGFNLNVSKSGTTYVSAQVTSVAADPDDSSLIVVNLDTDESIPTTVTGATVEQEKFFKNGCLDSVLGTYGSIDTASLTDGHAPFRFQNMEFCNGATEMVTNLRHTGSDQTKMSVSYNVNSSSRTWDTFTVPTVSAGYAEDYDFYECTFFPAGLSATSTTGYGAFAQGFAGQNSTALTVGTIVMANPVFRKFTGMGTMDFSVIASDALGTWSTRISSICDSSPIKEVE